jgi:hypothetical protein
MMKITQLERVEPEVAAKPASSAWGNRQRVLFVGLAIIVAGLTWASYLYVIRPQRVEVEQFTPWMTFELWRSLRSGIDRPARPTEIWFEAQVHAYQQWMIVAAAVTLVGLLITAGSFFLDRFPKPPPHDSSQ